MIHCFRYKRHFTTTEVIILCLFWLLLTVPVVDAQQPGLDLNIVDLPNGKSQLDGQFSLGFKEKWNANQHYLSYQTLPWLSLGLTYHQYHQQDNNDYQYDVGFDVFQQKHSPFTVKLGMQDFLDTASRRTAYIASTYQAGQVDLSLGLQHFRAQNRIFAGFSYTLPEWKSQLNLQLTNPIDYDHMVSAPRWQVNWKWFFAPNWMVNFSHSSKHNIGLGLQWQFDTKAPPATNRLRKPISDDLMLGLVERKLSKAEKIHYLIDRLKGEGVFIKALNIEPSSITVLIEQKRFTNAAFAVNFIHPYVKQLATQPIDRVIYIVEEHNVTIYKIAKPVSLVNTTFSSSVSLMPVSRIKPVLSQDLQRIETSWVQPLPHLTFGIDNRLWLPKEADAQAREYEKNKLEAQVFFALQGEWQWHPNSLIEVAYEVDVWDQLAPRRPSKTLSDDTLVPLRTARYQSFQDDDHRLERLVLKTFNQHNYQQHNSSSVFSYSAALGRLTHNVKGLSIDMLYRKWDSRFAFGANLVAVRPTGSLKYIVPDNTHIYSSLLSAYWSSPFYNLALAGHAGRFLGGDKGVKLALTRRFANGWQVGVWQTSSSLNGQHFSDRGLSITIPIGSLFKTSGASSIKSRLRDARGNSGLTLAEDKGNVGWPFQLMQPHVFEQ